MHGKDAFIIGRGLAKIGFRAWSEKSLPRIDPDGNRFSEKIMLHQKPGAIIDSTLSHQVLATAEIERQPAGPNTMNNKKV
jgi:hypothetical protein